MSTKGIFVAGTYTCIGKTVITAGLVHLLKSRVITTAILNPYLAGQSLRKNVLYLATAIL
ncbi:MAG TPA: AAA family ATPase [Candidatus Brocadiaceae bacterium]